MTEPSDPAATPQNPTETFVLRRRRHTGARHPGIPCRTMRPDRILVPIRRRPRRLPARTAAALTRATGPRAGRPKNGLGIAALILACCRCPPSSASSSGFALDPRRHPRFRWGHRRACSGEATNGGMAIAGVVLGIPASSSAR